jgi:hypothetical protein
MACTRRVWAERLRFWVRDNVVVGLLNRMADVSKRAASRQQAIPPGLVVTPLPPPPEQCESLQLPDDEYLQRGVHMARQLMHQTHQSGPQAGQSDGGLFAVAASITPQQRQEHAAKVKALQVVHKVGSWLECQVHCSACTTGMHGSRSGLPAGTCQWLCQMHHSHVLQQLHPAIHVIAFIPA